MPHDVAAIRATTIETLRKILPPDATSRALTTSELAKPLGVKAETIRRGLCCDGHYLGLTPVKLPNRRLIWPID